MRGCYWYVLFVSSFTYFAPRNGAHTFFHVDAQNFSLELIRKRLTRMKKRLVHFYQNYCMVMKMKKQLTLKRTGLCW